MRSAVAGPCPCRAVRELQAGRLVQELGGEMLMLPGPDVAEFEARSPARARARRIPAACSRHVGADPRISGPLPIIATRGTLQRVVGEVAMHRRLGGVRGRDHHDGGRRPEPWRRTPRRRGGAGRFSPTTGCPGPASRLPMARANVSLEPPGGEVTTKRIGLEGKAAECATEAADASANAATARRARDFGAKEGLRGSWKNKTAPRMVAPFAEIPLPVRGGPRLSRYAAGSRPACRGSSRATCGCGWHRRCA